MNTPPQSPRREKVCPGAPKQSKVKHVTPLDNLVPVELFLPEAPWAPERSPSEFVRPPNVRGVKLSF